MKMLYTIIFSVLFFSFCNNKTGEHSLSANVGEEIEDSLSVSSSVDSSFDDQTVKLNAPSDSELVKGVEDDKQKSSEAVNSNTKEKQVDLENERPALEEAPVYGDRIEQIGSKLDLGLHDPWDVLLKRYVSTDGRVNYKGLLADQPELEAYLKQLENTNVKTLNRDEQLAYWINAYNAYTIKLILENYPVKSIMDIDNGKPWDKKWINLDGRTLSLNDIENVIIRPEFKEPRIHFAVNCAAKSCPPLMNAAWTAEKLESQLEERTRSFINNTRFNRISEGQVKLSKIFEWYAVDFGNIQSYIDNYTDQSVSSTAKISYYEYDWALNE